MTRPTGATSGILKYGQESSERKAEWKKNPILISIIKFFVGKKERQRDSKDKVILNIHYNNQQAEISQHKVGIWFLGFSHRQTDRQTAKSQAP